MSLAFVLAAVACGLAALCYAEFASTVPVAGSAYTFSYATFGEFVAWIIGWDLVLEFAVGSAVVSKAWSEYLATLFGQLGVQVPTAVPFGPVTFDWGALLLVAALTTVLAHRHQALQPGQHGVHRDQGRRGAAGDHCRVRLHQRGQLQPVHPTARVRRRHSDSGLEQSLLSVLGGGSGSTYGVYGLLAAASIVFFAFIGFDVVATTAEETRNPQRSVPRGILGSLAIVTVLYVAVALVLTGMVPYTELATQPDGTRATLATAFASLGVNWAATVIAVGALAGLTTVVMVLMLGQIRVLFAMSRDALLPRPLARTGGHGTPVRATLVVGAAVAVGATFLPVTALEEMVNIGTLFAFVLVSVGVLVLRRTRPDLERGFRTPFVPLVPVLSVLACVWLMLNLSVQTWLRFVVWMVLGVIVYFTYGRGHSLVGRRLAAGRER